jgi:DNA-binding transcriptional LysR family regulator
MDPRKLIYLASIVEHGSFKKAAKSLDISQPALSTSMDRLEQSVGCSCLIAARWESLRPRWESYSMLMRG